MLSLAENNKCYNAGFKNTFDWISRKQAKVFHDKPMLLMATSPGRRGGASVLDFAKNHLPLYGAHIKGLFSLPSFNENFKPGQGITDETLNQQLLDLIREIESQEMTSDHDRA